MQTTFINNTGPQASHYRTPQVYAPQNVQPSKESLTKYKTPVDDWEPLFKNGRMALSIRSGIHTEVSWALNRLSRLSSNPGGLALSEYPGLLDGLYEWPEWYITEGHKHFTDKNTLFSPVPEVARQHRFTLESLLILRNATYEEVNVAEIASHAQTHRLIIWALYNLDPLRDENTEFLQLILDIYNICGAYYTYPPNILQLLPFPPLFRIISTSTNRTTIINALTALSVLFLNPANGAHLQSDSQALTAAIRYLPLFNDKPLINAALNYLYAHISHPSMARAFLQHPEMPSVVKVLASLLVHEQQGLEKTYTMDITGPVVVVPPSSQTNRDHELTQEELESLIPRPEPQRCYDWMKIMFVAKADGEVTQVDFWNMYKDSFAPYSEQHTLLVASDVIKNVNNVFPQAQAMVVQTPVQRFVVRGVDRRKDPIIREAFKCLWDRSQCSAESFASAGQLYDHVLQHFSTAEATHLSCLWSTCSQQLTSRLAMSFHILGHISSQPAEKHPSQSETITLASSSTPYPTSAPTTRAPPPPRNTTITYEVPILDPPSTSLTALLILRILFRTSFATVDAAPRVDGDHFGFPGIVEDAPEPESIDLADKGAEGDEREGGRRGRKTFEGVRKLLEVVQLRDDALMCWITEMLDAGIGDNNGPDTSTDL
ncbi:hypothetical protein CPB83DRAFT_842122 [Crepidotus variabilis]|uniref:RFX-type winged-helix domain-containing protein n=1 Tax=Crepidotus variabilis TaxID=179855 RepID=A0A9P6EVG8_9AGAR|nr:hypothetical protein CPB83DRAFT_842122 [Crepidotus variabilis]